MSVTATLYGVTRTPCSLKRNAEWLNIRWTATGDASAGTVTTGTKPLLTDGVIQQNDIVYVVGGDVYIVDTTTPNIFVYVGVGTWESFIFGNTGETMVISSANVIAISPTAVARECIPYRRPPIFLGRPLTSGQIGMNTSTNVDTKSYIFRLCLLVLKDAAQNQISVPVDIPRNPDNLNTVPFFKTNDPSVIGMIAK